MRAVHRLFFDCFGVAARIFFLEKVVHAYFSEFGGSLEILQTHFFWYVFNFLGRKNTNFRKHFPVSLEILQTRSKLIFFRKSNGIFVFIVSFFCIKLVSLEWVWRFSGLSPNSLQTRSKLGKLMCFQKYIFILSLLLVFFDNRSEFGVNWETLQTLSKLTWVWNINTRKNISYHIYIFCGRKVKLSKFGCGFGFSKLSPSSLQNHLCLERKPIYKQQILFLSDENQKGPQTCLHIGSDWKKYSIAKQDKI